MLAAFVIAVFQLNTSNLARLANALDLQCKKDSKYRRIKRFFTDAEIDLTIFARLILAMVKPDGKYVLALDRTEWKYGLVWVNILTLSIVVGNTSIPLFWKTLNRKGNSQLCEKKALLKRFIEAFTIENIEYLCADREFDGVEFVKYLDGEKIPPALAGEGFDADHRSARKPDQMREAVADIEDRRKLQITASEKIR